MLGAQLTADRKSHRASRRLEERPVGLSAEGLNPAHATRMLEAGADRGHHRGRIGGHAGERIEETVPRRTVRGGRTIGDIAERFGQQRGIQRPVDPDLFESPGRNPRSSWIASRPKGLGPVPR
jgi:hypothetical protein